MTHSWHAQYTVYYCTYIGTSLQPWCQHLSSVYCTCKAQGKFKNKPSWSNYFSTQRELYLPKSLSTSYSYFIHVSLYTKNSRKASIAMRENAIRDTEGSMKMSIAPNVDVNVQAPRLFHLYLSPRWPWTPHSSQELWGRRPAPSPESKPFSWWVSSS